MPSLEQERLPIVEALMKYAEDGVVPFHVPGHKQGRGLPDLKEYLGERALAMDLTCTPDLDNILSPHGAIAEAEQLAAETLGADQAFFLVNGTTSGIQAMIMAACRPGEKLILPRNAHKSATGGLILSGALPVYVEPEIDHEFGISMGVTPEKVEHALREHPDARAVFLVYPNYYGTACDLEEIVRLAHGRGVPVLVDEAHGAHFAFHRDLPPSAMQAGADLAASSAHKLLGSLTQSSILLMKDGLLKPRRVKSVLNLTQTTSPSYLLLASLDLARRQMALSGREVLERVLRLSRQVRDELSCLQGMKLLGEEVAGRPGCTALDPTKITVNVQKLGLSGFEAEDILRRRYRLQVELSDLYNVMALITLGDNEETVQCLLRAFRGLAKSRTSSKVLKALPALPALPRVITSLREAFYSDTRTVNLEEAEGEISAEMVMAYPPGIPLVCPGELVTRELIDYIRILRLEHAELQGAEDPEVKQLKVLKATVAIPGPEEVEAG